MMAFFCTIPINRMMPISAMMLKSVCEQHQCEQRADASRGKRGKNRQRMNVAFVQHSQHDIDSDQRRQNQQRLVGERRLKRPAPCPGSWGDTEAGRPISLSTLLNRVHGIAERSAWRQIEGERHDGKLPLMVDRERRGPVSASVVNALSGTWFAVRRSHVNIFERIRDCVGNSDRLPESRGIGSAA